MPQQTLDKWGAFHEENAKLRAENERLNRQLVSDIRAETEIDRLETANERLTAEIKTVRNTAMINLKVAQDRGAEIERLRAQWVEDQKVRFQCECENEGLRAALQRTKDWHDGLIYIEKPIVEFPLAMIEAALANQGKG